MTSQQKSLPINDAEIMRRKLTQYCLKSLSLEGIEADSETLAQLELLDNGKVTIDEFVAHMLKKAGVDAKSAVNNEQKIKYF